MDNKNSLDKKKAIILITGLFLFFCLAILIKTSVGSLVSRGEKEGSLSVAGNSLNTETVSSERAGAPATDDEEKSVIERIRSNVSTEDMIRASAGFTVAMEYSLDYDTEDGNTDGSYGAEGDTGGETTRIKPPPVSDDPEVMATYLAQSKANSIDNLWGYTNLGIANVDNHLNVREKPSEEGKLVAKMTRGAACEILSVEGVWAHIKSGKVTGYVHTDFLLTGDAARERAAKEVSLKAVVNTQTLKVRDEPNTDSPVVTLVARDERLEIVSLEVPGWAQIMLDDEKVYVSTDYCIIDEVLDTAITTKEILHGSGVSDTRVNLVAYAKQFIGNPYVWGGTSLTKGADCSGFVLSVFKKYGVKLPRTSREQANVGTGIKLSEAKPGDLIFYAKGGTINHVAIYIGNGQVVHASNPKSGIKISNATYRSPARIRRVLS